MTYGVRVNAVRLRFSAAHMATFDGRCEPLHGHNYQLAVEVEGALTDDSWVMDFGLLKRISRERCEQIDHHFLLQTKSRVVAIEETELGWQLTAPGGAHYHFPAADVAPLPIDNTTAERLAEWFHGELSLALIAAGQGHIVALRVEVEEAPGQSGWYAAPVGAINSG